MLRESITFADLIMSKQPLIRGFASGTLVQTQKGFKKIERIKVGELVRSLPQSHLLSLYEVLPKAPVEYHRVTEVIALEADECYHYRTHSALSPPIDGKHEVYFVGSDQCFYSAFLETANFFDHMDENHYKLPKNVKLPWIPLNVMTPKHPPMSPEINSVRMERRTKVMRPVTLYNLKVETHNTYLIGRNRLWVMGA